MALDDNLAYSPEKLLDFITLIVAFLGLLKHYEKCYRYRSAPVNLSVLNLANSTSAQTNFLRQFFEIKSVIKKCLRLTLVLFSPRFR